MPPVAVHPLDELPAPRHVRPSFGCVQRLDLPGCAHGFHLQADLFVPPAWARQVAHLPRPLVQADRRQLCRPGRGQRALCRRLLAV